jgi:hypothetical protein
VGELTFFRAATGFLKKLIFRFFNLLKQTVKPVFGVKDSDRKINDATFSRLIRPPETRFFEKTWFLRFICWKKTALTRLIVNCCLLIELLVSSGF